MIKNITIGSDPEFFLVKKGLIVSSVDYIDGSKHFPYPLGDDYHVLKDNVLVEGNIPPTKTKKEFIDTMNNLKERIVDLIGEEFSLISADSAEFDRIDLMHPEAQEFGCSPYKNAWNNEELMADDLSEINFRVAGFHIHIGYTLDSSKSDYKYEDLNILIAKAFDYFVVYPSRLEHSDPIREEYYGGFGNYRDKPYGVEVRSLGGHFTSNKYLSWVYDQTIKTLEYCKDIENLEKLKSIDNPTKNPELYYKILNINLKEQIYAENPNVIVDSSSIIKEAY